MEALKVFNTKVYGLAPSIVRSGYPMAIEIPDTLNDFTGFSQGEMASHYKRAVRLGNSPIGSGHDTFLKGIIVQMDVEAPSYWWPQLQRYNHVDFISSQSKMHRARQLAGLRGIDYDPNATDEEIVANLKQDFELTAGLSTNYLQLKTIHFQRKNHKLKMWREIFCPWIAELPYAKEFGVLGG